MLLGFPSTMASSAVATQHLKLSLLSFLRTTCVLQRALFSPKSLALPLPGSFDALVSELTLPGLHAFVTVATCAPGSALLQGWRSLALQPTFLYLVEPDQPSLAALPHAFPDLLATVNTFKCLSSGGPCQRPAVCLSCGDVICSQCVHCGAANHSIGPLTKHFRK